MSPAVAPNGTDMVYLETQMDFDIVSISLATGEVTPLISTALRELMPQYAANGGRLTYVTDRQGPMEIWLREPDGATRPLVTPKDIPGGVKWFMAPALSPDGSRIIFSVTPPTGVPRLWMASVSGGAPVRVTNATDDGGEYPGDWSPDGSKFVFRTYRNGQPGLAVVSTDGVAQLKQLGTMGGDAMTALPSWSPIGDRIAYRDTGGFFFMDPDGNHKHMFLKLAANEFVPNLAFSKDGKTLYGTDTSLGKINLISVDADTGAMKKIRELPPTEAALSDLTPTLRFSLAPDGQTMTYATGQFHSTLWLFQGWGE
jgi:Tol biopolymer transport system component